MMSTIPLPPHDGWLMDFLQKSIPSLSSSQLRNLSQFCLGLLAPIPHKSISAICESLLIPKDQSTLNRTLTESDWGCEIKEIELNTIAFMLGHKQTGFKSGGSIIIDDSLLKKSGTCMDLVGEHFDHCSFTMENGLSLVSVHYSDDVKQYHLLKDVYLRKSYLEEHDKLDQFKTKVEISETFVDTLLENVPSIKTKNLKFLFDSWFLANSLISKLKKHDLKFVSRAKSNRIILGLGMSLKYYASTVLKESDFKKVSLGKKGKDDHVFIYSRILPISNLGDVNISFVKQKRGGAVRAFIVSNDLTLSGMELVQYYKERWAIETAYKDSKQYVGLADFHLRKKKGTLRYLTLCFLISTYLEYLRLMGTLGHYFGVSLDVSTKGKQIKAYQCLIFERFLVWIHRQYRRGENLDSLLLFFRGECSLCSEEHLNFIKNSAHVSFNRAVVGM